MARQKKANQATAPTTWRKGRGGKKGAGKGGRRGKKTGGNDEPKVSL